MRNLLPEFALMISLLLVPGASAHGVAGEGHGHGHGHGHGSDHGAGHDTGGHDHEADAIEPIAVTRWHPGGELFMEYVPPVVGQPVRFIIHLTVRADHAPVREGVLTLSFEREGREPLKSVWMVPARDGIYLPSVTFAEAGPHRMVIELDSRALEDRFLVEPVMVHPDRAAAKSRSASARSEGDDGISFLKEQQWVTSFRVVDAGQRPIRPTIRAVGKVQPLHMARVQVSSPIDGRIRVPDHEGSPGYAELLGRHVVRGESLVCVIPPVPQEDLAHLQKELAQARVEVGRWESETARVQRLRAGGAIPAKQLEAARASLDMVRLSETSARQHLEHYLALKDATSKPDPASDFVVESPIGGRITQVFVHPGETIRAGQPIVEVVDMHRLLVVARVFEADLDRVSMARTAAMRFMGHAGSHTLESLAGSIRLIGHEIDPETRTVPLYLEIGNPEGALRIGMFAEVDLVVGEGTARLAVPREALYEDGGHDVVYVQTRGETFQKRRVTTGMRDREWIEVLAGVSPGEHVVTLGGYEIQLASQSTAIPAHGHVH